MLPPPNSPATGQPAINGDAQVEQTLTASISAIADANGMTQASFAYQWFADDSEISNATSSTYTLTDVEQDAIIKVRVSFTDDGYAESRTSEPTGAVEPRPNQPAAGAPAITGTTQVGETLTADTSVISDPDGLDNVSFTYQWLADEVAISSATSSTYTLTDDDLNKTVKVRVSFTDDAGHDESLTSEATAQVAAAPNQTDQQNQDNTASYAIPSVTLTVKHFGYGDVGGNSDAHLADETGDMEVVWLWFSERNRQLELSFKGPLHHEDAMTLPLDNVTLSFPEGTSGKPGFVFKEVDIDWTDGQVVAVSIVR